MKQKGKGTRAQRPQQHEPFGAHLQRWLDTLAAGLGGSRLRTELAGIAVSLAIIIGGLAVFVAVWALLVGVVK